jgi:hypothetical protein
MLIFPGIKNRHPGAIKEEIPQNRLTGDVKKIS